MRSDIKGMCHYLGKENPDSIYLWCYSHRLNLVIQGSCDESSPISVMLDLIQTTAKFIKTTYKRNDIYVDVVVSTPGINGLTRMKLIGQTRRSSKYEAISSAVKTEVHLFVLLKTLVKIRANKTFKKEAKDTANQLFYSWYTNQNILLCVILNYIFIDLNEATNKLQECGINILDSIKIIENLYNKLKKNKFK